MITETVKEVAAEFRCSPRKISDVARDNSIGMNLQGRAGWRFTEADKAALREAMRPKRAVETKRKRRVR